MGDETVTLMICRERASRFHHFGVEHEHNCKKEPWASEGLRFGSLLIHYCAMTRAAPVQYDEYREIAIRFSIKALFARVLNGIDMLSFARFRFAI
jgi:hypothetical protein